MSFRGAVVEGEMLSLHRGSAKTNRDGLRKTSFKKEK